MMASHKLSLSVQYADGGISLPTRQQFRRWIKAALQRDVQIVLRIVDEIEGRALNKKFRGKDYATNVLTFSYADNDQAPDTTDLLYGDIVICAPVVEQEAREQQKDLRAHYAHLAIHAALHLQGYDHENELDAATMEPLETKLLAKLGYADPYKAVESET
ncbi:MAG: rRNA maturation RNase YbeY [Candidatus Nitrotoga sp.]